VDSDATTIKRIRIPKPFERQLRIEFGSLPMTAYGQKRSFAALQKIQ